MLSLSNTKFFPCGYEKKNISISSHSSKNNQMHNNVLELEIFISRVFNHTDTRVFKKSVLKSVSIK